MPFDPTLPVAHTLNSAAQMRAQLNGLKALIDAILTVTDAEVDAVTTVNPGDPAAVEVTVVGEKLHLSFTIPRGNDGAQGLPFADAVVDGVTTLNPEEAATVSVTFDGTFVRFTFSIPRGSDGNAGADGAPGAPGEVTNADLAAALTTTSNNTDGVATLDTAFVNDPATPADMELMRAKVNEFILAARR